MNKIDIALFNRKGRYKKFFDIITTSLSEKANSTVEKVSFVVIFLVPCQNDLFYKVRCQDDIVWRYFPEIKGIKRFLIKQ